MFVWKARRGGGRGAPPTGGNEDPSPLTATCPASLGYATQGGAGRLAGVFLEGQDEGH